MDRWDLDNDGHISESEMERGINRAFAELDKDGDGMIYEAELRAFILEHPSAHVSLKMVHTMFVDLDTNADGMLSKDELKQLCI